MRRLSPLRKAGIFLGLVSCTLAPGAIAQPVGSVEVNMVNPKNKVPSFLTLSAPKSTAFDEATMASWFRSDLAANADFQLAAVSDNRDAAGVDHYKYKQYYKGVPVEGSMVRAHFSEGKMTSVNGDFYPALKVPMTPLLDETRARDIAFGVFPPGAFFAWKDKVHESILRRIDGNDKATFYPKGELVVVSKQFSLKQEDFRLAYKFNIFSLEPLTRKLVYVDARNGEVLYTSEQIHTLEVPGIAYTRYSGVQRIVCDSIAADTMLLYETIRGGGILTLNARQCSVIDSVEMFHNNSRTWNNVNAQQDEVATDIHWSIEATYDFYLNKMGRNSVDNKGRMLVGMGHFGKKFNNAFWNGSFAAFGDGDSVHMYPLASLDICAHEISHGVTQETAGLLYDNEPGALNESYSDILGKCVEHYSLPATFSWQIGAQILCGKKPMRDMQDPQAALQPKFYGGAFYYKGKDDNGGVHINGGVQNYWFYLLCEGGSGFRESDAALFTVKPIGWDKAAMLVYNTLTNYMTVSSGYADAAYYSMTAAKALFGAGSEEARQVQMAWYAVGLADKPLSTGIDDVSLSSFSVYPNPVSGNSLRLSFDHPVSGSVLRLSDMSGKVLLQKENPIAGSDLDISALSNGIYLLELSSGAAISRTKIIKY